jgi:hypothetical protein
MFHNFGCVLVKVLTEVNTKVSLNFSKLIFIKVTLVGAVGKLAPIEVTNSVDILVGVHLEHGHIVELGFSNRRQRTIIWLKELFTIYLVI